MTIFEWLVCFIVGMSGGWALRDYLQKRKQESLPHESPYSEYRDPSEIIGRDDKTGAFITREQWTRIERENREDFNKRCSEHHWIPIRQRKKFSGNSHDRRIQRRAHAREKETPLS